MLAAWQRLPRARQPRPRRRADRPLAGRLRPQAPHRDGRSTARRRSGGCSSRRSCSAGRCMEGARPGRRLRATCRRARRPSQTGCVVAYSSFARRPAARRALRPGQPLDRHVLCVNPARPGAPAGATASITPLFPTAVTQLIGGPLAAAAGDAVGRVPRPLPGKLPAHRYGELAADRPPAAGGRPPPRRGRSARLHVGPAHRRRQHRAPTARRARRLRGARLYDQTLTGAAGPDAATVTA